MAEAHVPAPVAPEAAPREVETPRTEAPSPPPMQAAELAAPASLPVEPTAQAEEAHPAEASAVAPFAAPAHEVSATPASEPGPSADEVAAEAPPGEPPIHSGEPQRSESPDQAVEADAPASAPEPALGAPLESEVHSPTEPERTASVEASDTSERSEPGVEATAPSASPQQVEAPELNAPALVAAVESVENGARPASASRPSLPPPLPIAEPPQVAAASLAPPSPSSMSKPSLPAPASFSPEALSARAAALQARVVSAVPPRWIETARRYPALWMAAAPAIFALVFTGLVVAVQPPAKPSAPRVAVAAASSPTAAPPPAAVAAPVSEPVAEQKPTVSLGALESKAPESLTIDELLLLREARAQHKREDVQALARKLADQPELVKDAAVQAQLLRFASDPDTAAEALRAMAGMKSPVGPDLLYEVLGARPAPGTVELARSLLNSGQVRPEASPALAVALELSSSSCEAVKASLPRAKADADRRALPALSRLNSRRGCGADKSEDCFACLRSEQKLVSSAVDAAKKRRPPSYPR